MRLRGWMTAMIVMMASNAALAQTDAPTRFAAVDASGRIRPVPSTTRDPDVIDRATTGASPCGEAVALPVDAARALVERVARQENFYPDFVLSVAKIESRYGSTVLSGKGAYGLMQLMPDTARRFEVDLCDPEANVRGGVRFLRLLHGRYRNPFFILAAYNAGEDAVRKNRGVPPFPETVRFVADVMNDFYTWPGPVGTGSGVGERSASASADITEVAGTPAASAPPSNPSPPRDPHAALPWSDGFVMHVD